MNFKPRNFHTSMFIQICRQNHPRKLSIDDKAINNFLPSLFNNWVTVSSKTHQYETSSSAKGLL